MIDRPPREQTLDPVAVRRALGLQLDELAVGLAGVLGLGGRDADGRPDPTVAEVPADEHRDQLGGVEAIALGPPLATIDPSSNERARLAC
jgi:hypothetical protein